MLQMDFDDILWTGSAWPNEVLIKFCWRSGSRSVSRSGLQSVHYRSALQRLYASWCHLANDGDLKATAILGVLRPEANAAEAEHGARYIYDTDDDNFLETDLSGFQSTQQSPSQLVLVTSNLTSNPYVHFGQSTMWPRGYPLDRVGLGADRRYSVCNTAPPAVQQGLVDGDPDVDAIFRLTRRRKAAPLRLSFDRAAPPYALPPRTFAPFNSQNTFFESSAFWALLLPVNSVSDRAVDIYRSYWAQRLLWLVGGGVMFAPPATVQVRNAHSDLVDADDEAVLYRDVGRYIDVLNRWECDAEAQFMFDCVAALSRHLAREGLWTSKDADMVDAWLADLASVGYVPPQLPSARSPIDPCFQSNQHRVVFYPVEQNTTMPHSTQLAVPGGSTNRGLVTAHLNAVCGPQHGDHWAAAMRHAHKYPGILLVISVPGNIHASLPNLEAVYRPHFANIVYCTRHRINDDFIDLWKVSIVWVDEDPALLPCLLVAGVMGYRVNGVLHISANMFLNSQRGRMAELDESLVWMPGELHAYSQSTLSRCYRRSVACRHMSRDVIARFVETVEDSVRLSNQQKMKLKACVTKLERDPTWNAQKDVLWVADLAMYVPLRLIPRLARLREALSPDHSPQHELLVPLMLECEQLTVNFLHHSVEVDALSDSSSRLDYILSFPFDKINTAVDATKQLCSYVEQFK